MSKSRKQTLRIVNSAVQYIGELRELSLITKEKKNFFFFLFFLLYLYEMMEVSWTYCGNCFTVYVNQTITLYALNLQSDVCQLFLNKTGKNYI